MLVLISRLEGFDKSLEEASLDLGENAWMTFWRVTFPLAWPGIVSSLLLCFIASFDEFVLAFFLSGNEATLPVFIWSQLRFPARLPGVLALGSCILLALLHHRRPCRMVAAATGARNLKPAARRHGSTTDSFIIDLRGVSKHFGSVRAVDDVSLRYPGAASSSPCSGPRAAARPRCCACSPASSCRTRARSSSTASRRRRLPPNERPTNMVFQSYAIFPHLNVAENIAYGLRKRGPDARREIAARVDEALELIKLPATATARAHQLSGGQRQRVALARALVCRPKVLLLDEPLGALDKKLREEMQIELRQLQRSVGITFVFVTHDQEEALTMSDRIAVMSKGKVAPDRQRRAALRGAQLPRGRRTSSAR